MEWNLDTFTTEVNVCSHQGSEGIQKMVGMFHMERFKRKKI